MGIIKDIQEAVTELKNNIHDYVWYDSVLPFGSAKARKGVNSLSHEIRRSHRKILRKLGEWYTESERFIQVEKPDYVNQYLKYFLCVSVEVRKYVYEGDDYTVSQNLLLLL